MHPDLRLLANFLNSDFFIREEQTSKDFANFDNPKFELSQDCLVMKMNPKKRRKLEPQTNQVFLIKSGVNYTDCQHIYCKYSQWNNMKCHPWGQRIQFLRKFGFSDSLVVVTSNVQGWGVQTNSFIPKDKIILEYTGEIIDSWEKYQRELQRREVRPNELAERNRKTPKPETYFFKVKFNSYIDGGTGGNISKYINHSCNPNCDSSLITVDGENIVVISAIRDILPGEELTFDYKKNDIKTKCKCKTTKCRGFI